MVHGLEEGSRWLKSCPMAAGRGSGRGPLKDAPCCARGGAFWRDTPPGETSWPAKVSQVPSSWWFLLLHLGSGSPRSHREGGLCRQIQKGLIHIFLQGNRGFHGIHLSWDTFCEYQKRVLLLCWFYIFKRAQLTSVRSDLHLPEPFCCGGNRSPEREGDVGALEIQDDQVADDGLYLIGIILMNLGAYGWLTIRS